MISANDGADKIRIDSISLPNFEISWAGGNPFGPGYWLGSEGGRIQITGFVNPEWAGPYAVSPSGDAVNGMAFADDLWAVSTRSEVVFLNVPYTGEGHVEQAVFHGGAHGVVSTQSGSIVASLGKRGILSTGPKSAAIQRVQALRPADDALNIYRVVSLMSPGRGEVLACAGRQGGIAALLLNGADGGGFGQKLQPPGMDFIDVAALGVDGYPLSIVALGLDCSICLVRDLLGDRNTNRLRFNPVGERGFRVLCAEGHVFLLTNKRLYSFVNLAARFLDGDAFAHPTTVRWLDIEAVDASLAFDRTLLVVMPNCVYRIPIDSLVTDGVRLADHLGLRSEKRMSKETLPTDLGDKSWESFEKSPWGKPVELQLAAGIV